MNIEGFLITIAILHALSLGIAMKEHGTYREGKNNAWVTILGIIIIWSIIWIFGLI